jgi:formate hydrogenlyase transcriptional activator
VPLIDTENDCRESANPQDFELALRESEARMALATEAAGTAPWVLNIEENCFWVGGRMMEVFGLPPGDRLTLAAFLDLVHPDDRPTIRRTIEAALLSRELAVVEYRIVRPDGQIRWLLSRGRTYQKAGAEARFMGVTTDITSRKQMEEHLAIANRQTRFILGAVAEGVVGLDLLGNHIFVNPAAAEMLGYAPEDLLGRSGHEIWHHSQSDGTAYPEDRCPICAACREGVEGHVTDEVFWRKDGGCFPVDYKCTPISETGRRVGVVITFEDITRRQETDKTLRESESRMAAALDVAELGFYEVLNGVRVTFLDRRTCEILGLSAADEKAGRILEFWGEHLHPEDRPGIMEVRRAMEEAGRDRTTVDYRFLHPQRGVLHIHHLSHVMERDAAGRAVRTIGVLRDVTEQKVLEFDLRKALDDVRQLRDQLHRENVYLREQMCSESGHGAIVGESEPIKRMLALARKVAPTDSAVLITGETGTGKELLAQAIHDFSSRKKKLMVKVNCAALPAPLIESELFGREKGAYTGAMTQQVGRFEVANGSTIFLDEIGDLPLDLQTKLLRVLQDGLYERLGSNCTLKADVRVIAATNRDLSAMIREGKFREDLFHRLNVFPIEVPALRIRGEDIPLLVWKFVQEFNTKMGRSIDAISKPAMERLKRYAWPGNVRELRNVIERAMIVSEGRSLRIELPEADQRTVVAPATLEAVERKHILGVLESTRWRISGKGGAAEILGLQSTTLHSRLKKLGLSRPS